MGGIKLRNGRPLLSDELKLRLPRHKIFTLGQAQHVKHGHGSISVWSPHYRYSRLVAVKTAASRMSMLLSAPARSKYGSWRTAHGGPPLGPPLDDPAPEDEVTESGPEVAESGPTAKPISSTSARMCSSVGAHCVSLWYSRGPTFTHTPASTPNETGF
eukprot:850066-Prorocentrum_minimum.AAC.4